MTERISISQGEQGQTTVEYKRPKCLLTSDEQETTTATFSSGGAAPKESLVGFVIQGIGLLFSILKLSIL
jgi:hypothetical protein